MNVLPQVGVTSRSFCTTYHVGPQLASRRGAQRFKVAESELGAIAGTLERIKRSE